MALLLYTGQGFLRTAGVLLGITVGAIAAGVWAGDVGSRSTRGRTVIMILAFLVASAFAAVWPSAPSLRAETYGGSLAVLLMLAIPSYATGGMLAGLFRHRGYESDVGVQALAGASLGLFLVTTYGVPHIEAWSVFFAAAALLVPTALIPVTMTQDSTAVGGPMRDRVVIITGVGSTGQLGYAIARRFAAAGARLVVVARTDEIRSLATELGDRDRIVGVRADLTRQADVDGVIQAARAFGRLDALINVAGGLTVMHSIDDTTSEEFRREMSINAETVLMMSKAALPMLRESHGCIVNFASPAGERAVAGLGAYSAAKAAVIALTRSLALEERGTGVRVNAIAPGLMDTEVNREKAEEGARFVTREQVVDVVSFLMEANGVNGETIHVMGETLR
ncbi:MAG: SDR family oxidoreductase [Longimicrobiales bacterium]